MFGTNRQSAGSAAQKKPWTAAACMVEDADSDDDDDNNNNNQLLLQSAPKRRRPKYELFPAEILRLLACAKLHKARIIVGNEYNPTNALEQHLKKQVEKCTVHPISSLQHEYIPQHAFSVFVNAETKTLVVYSEESRDDDSTAVVEYVLKRDDRLMIQQEEFQPFVHHEFSSIPRQAIFFSASTQPRTVRGLEDSFKQHVCSFVSVTKEKVQESLALMSPRVAETIVGRVALEVELRSIQNTVQALRIQSPHAFEQLPPTIADAFDAVVRAEWEQQQQQQTIGGGGGANDAVVISQHRARGGDTASHKDFGENSTLQLARKRIVDLEAHVKQLETAAVESSNAHKLLDYEFKAAVESASSDQYKHAVETRDLHEEVTSLEDEIARLRIIINNSNDNSSTDQHDDNLDFLSDED